MDNGKRFLAPDVVRALKAGRRGRGWSYRAAASHVGVSAAYLCHLERGRRVPSSVVAEILIEAYRLGAQEAERLRHVAVPDAGRSSPWRPVPR